MFRNEFCVLPVSSPQTWFSCVSLLLRISSLPSVCLSLRFLFVFCSASTFISVVCVWVHTYFIPRRLPPQTWPRPYLSLVLPGVSSCYKRVFYPTVTKCTQSDCSGFYVFYMYSGVFNLYIYIYTYMLLCEWVWWNHGPVESLDTTSHCRYMLKTLNISSKIYGIMLERKKW